MKIISLLLFLGLIGSSRAASFTNSADADTFVRASAPTLNYGGAGALSVSGTNATNTSGTTNGVFDSFIRFNTTAMVAGFNSRFGVNNWVINGAKLQVTEVGAPMQTIFNRGKGAFEIRWIANDTWIEGTGTPMAPTTDGVAFNGESALLNVNTDMSLGTFTNAGVDGTLGLSLNLPANFTSDLRAGGEVGLYLTAIDSKIGFTFDSRSFGTAAARPVLLVSAVPQPGISSLGISGTDIVMTATNGVSSGTYYVLSSTNVALSLDQWTPVATNVLTADGGFTNTLTNALSAAPQQFYILQTQ